ncbi:MAG: zinc ABC transporter substrate-binding protein [Candidatus Aminicenantes bacterium]|nr:MAG: zinc ABC transporter substrate-binding protein [Candidatus Aminicenantes bacterium]
MVFQSSNLSASDEINIVTSVFPLKEFAEAVCGDRGEVSLLLPPGAEIHTWKPRPSDIVRISSADIFIYIGRDLEPWLHGILRSVKNPKLRILEASQGISLMEEESHRHQHADEHEAVDPHIWLDFEIDQIIIDKITAVLSEVHPEGSSIFKRNAGIYKEKLQKLDIKYREGLRSCVHRTFIIGGHAAFGYLARRYNLHQISLYGLSPDSKPTAKQLIEVIEEAKEHKIKTIYFEIAVSDDLTRVISEEIGARILVLNPGANLSKEQLRSGVTFFDIMEKNLESLKHGLICK